MIYHITTYNNISLSTVITVIKLATNSTALFDPFDVTTLP